MNRAKGFTAKEAYQIMRLFVRLNELSLDLMRQGRIEDGSALARLTGALEYRVFGYYGGINA